MAINKSKLKSIQEMWRVMQELSTKQNRNKIEETTLKVCTQFFMSSEDFVNMFEDCMAALSESPQVTPTVTAPIEPVNGTSDFEKGKEEGLAMFTALNMEIPHPHLTEPISSDLEAQQLSEFHAMMGSVNFETES